MVTLRDAVSSYIGACRARGARPATIHGKGVDTRILLRSLDPDTDVADVTTEDVEAVHLEWSTADPRPSRATILRRVSTIKTFFNYCIEQGWIAEGKNPARHIKALRPDRIEARYLTREQMQRFFHVINYAIRTARTPEAKFAARRDKAMFRFIVGSGLRISEACALRVGDVDSTQHLMTIRDAKGGFADQRPVSGRVADALAGYIRYSRLAPETDDAYVFRAAPDSPDPTTPAAARYRFKAYARDAGLDESLGPHALRHTFGTLAARAAGGDLRPVAVAMGHRSIGSTRIYAHIERDQVDAMLKRVGTMVG